MGIGFRELLIILAIALLIFGAKKLRNIGSDLGAAVRGFKKSMNDGEDEESGKKLAQDSPPRRGLQHGQGRPRRRRLAPRTPKGRCSRSASPRSS